MIIGKPITFGSGGLMAEISVGGDVLSTDTITCTNGLKSYSAIWVTDHFVISGLDLGTYTVTATRGSKSKSYDVLIDEIAVYEVSVVYRTYLYNLGDECESLTGGWSSSNYPTVTKNNDNIYISKSINKSELNYVPTIATINKIDVTNYSQIKMEFSQVNVSGACLGLTVSTQRKRTSDDSVARIWTNQGQAYNHFITELDISAVSGSYYVYVNTNGNVSNTFNGNVYKVWLE